MQIDHIGYAVKNIQNAAVIFRILGFSQLKEPTFDPIQGLWISLVTNENQVIELISPDAHKASIVDRLLSANGPTPYHLCFSTENIEQELEMLSGQGFRKISKTVPTDIFEGRRMCFLYHKEIGLIELLENDKRNGE